MSKKLLGSTRGPFGVNKDAKQFIVIVVWNLVVEGNKHFENFKVDGLMWAIKMKHVYGKRAKPPFCVKVEGATSTYYVH